MKPLPTARGLRWGLLLATLALVAVATGVTAWTLEEIEPAEEEYRSAFVYYYGGAYLKDEYVMSSYTSITIQPNFRGYMSFPVSRLDDRVHIHSASVTFIARNMNAGWVRIYVHDRELHELDPELAYTDFDDAYHVGTLEVDTQLAYETYTHTITGDPLNALRDVVAGDDDYVVIGFTQLSGYSDIFARYRDASGRQYSVLTLEYDASPPRVPSMVAMPPFSTGANVTAAWGAVADRPQDGAVGGVEYQVGVYLPGWPADMPYISSPWVETTSWNLTAVAENVEYTLRVRARDALGFTSDWSSPVATRVDNTPPTVPVITPLPAYAEGAERLVEWSVSEDAGSGDVMYTLQVSSDRLFADGVLQTLHTPDLNYTFGDLGANATYFYRVRAWDDLGHESAWSWVEGSTQDWEPPTVPVMMDEPAFTAGLSNTIHWHPSWDGGAGVDRYEVQVSYLPGFMPVSILTVPDPYTDLTTFTMPSLWDQHPFWYRVRAYDALGHVSEWSEPVNSTQDDSGPSAPAVHELRAYSPGWPLTLSWDPSVDMAGISHYEVWWSTDSRFLGEVHAQIVLGERLVVTDLDEGTWYFRVWAYDRVGHAGPASTVSTTVDTTPPSRPVLDPLPDIHGSTTLEVGWTPGTDESSGVSHELCWVEDDLNGALHRWVTTSAKNFTINGLVDGVTYWIFVTAIDSAGNPNMSQMRQVTIDATPPPAPSISGLPAFTAQTEVEFMVRAEVDGSVGNVEHQVRWMEVSSPPTDDGYMGATDWTTFQEVVVEGLSDGVYEFWAVARDGRGLLSGPSAVVGTTIDTIAPELSIISPRRSDRLSGTVTIRAHADDTNLLMYMVSYRPVGHGTSVGIIAAGALQGGQDGFAVPWDTRSVGDGHWTISVEVSDAAGWTDEEEVTVEVMNALIVLSPLDFRLSDPTPTEGKEVTVSIPVRNTGRAPAMNVTVEVYLDGELVHTEEGLDIHFYREAVVTYTFKAKDGQELTARVTGFYESAEMPTGYVVRTESVDEGVDPGPALGALVLGALALIVAAVALLLALTSRKRSAGKGEWVETKD